MKKNESLIDLMENEARYWEDCIDRFTAGEIVLNARGGEPRQEEMLEHIRGITALLKAVGRLLSANMSAVEAAEAGSTVH